MLNNLILEANNVINGFILFFTSLNVILTTINHNYKRKDLKKTDADNYESKIENTKNIIISIFVLVIIVLVTLKHLDVLLAFALIESFRIIFTQIKHEQIEFNEENNLTYITSSYMLVLFTQNEIIIQLYPIILSISIHYIKEIILTIFIIIKIIGSTISFFINIGIFIVEIKKVLIKIPKIKETIIWIKNPHEVNYQFFSFSTTKQTKMQLFKDAFIFTITIPLYLSFYLVIQAFRIFINFLRKIISIATKIGNIRINKIIPIGLRYGLIMSLIITYAIIVQNSHFFSSTFTEIYNLIATVILIPTLYENIKKQNDSIK